MKRKTFLLAAVLTLIVTAAAQAAEPRSFSVTVTGKGAPMILIPGLASSGAVWQSTVDHFKGRYRCHVITIAGFGGAAPLANAGDDALLARVERDLVSYIREQKLARPVIVGHSLGGFLALSLAAHEPKLVGRAISVDGVAFLPALFDPNATAETSAKNAAPLRDAIASMTREQWSAQSKATLGTMATSAADVEKVVAMSSASDPKTVARAMYELMSTDVRPQLARSDVPILLIAATGRMPEAMQPAAKKAYEAQVANAPNAKVVVDPRARHFIMYDDPQFLFAAMDEFLK